MDNATAIECVAEGVLTLGVPESDKYFHELYAFSSPGCQATLQIAITDSFNRKSLRWQNVGSLVNGYAHYGFPPSSRGKLLFWRVSEMSTDARFNFYGFSIEAENIE